jgi:hypothetical protein
MSVCFKQCYAPVIASIMRSKNRVFVVQEQMYPSYVVAIYFGAATMSLFATETVVKI